MIELVDIHFGYSKKKMLFKELNLTMGAGHIYGLLGRNGAGKTSLLKIITGLVFPQRGVPTVMGKRSEKRIPEILSSIYFVTEEIYTPHLKIKDYVRNYGSFYPSFNLDQFNRYLQEFEIIEQHVYIDKLSYGQKKKVHISFALATNTPILLMDEPTNGLDIPSKSIFRKIMASEAREDKIILISTHQVRDLHSLIDSVIIIDQGEIIFHESNDRITEKLAFQIEEDNRDPSCFLYSEDNIRGRMVVRENTDSIETKLDIELFFNALMSNKEKIRNIFKKQN